MSKKVGTTDFEKKVILGMGGYGKVFLVRKVGGYDHGRLYALKQVRKTTEMRRMGYFMNERKVLECVRGQPFLATLHYAFETETDLNVVLDFINGGDLFNQKVQQRKLSERSVQFYISELVLALEHLHKLKIVHRDVKPENILIDSGGHIVLTDFGFSKMVSGDEIQHWDACGTLKYFAPEIIQRRPDQKHGYAIDWWALGVVAYELVTGHSPFASGSQGRSKKDICWNILCNTTVYPSSLSMEARDFISSLLHKDPNKRLGTRGADEVKKHPFFNDVNWDDVSQRKVPVPFLPCLSCKMDVRYFSDKFTNMEVDERAEVKPCPCTGSPATSSTNHSTNKLFRDFSYVGAPINLLEKAKIERMSDATVPRNSLSFAIKSSSTTDVRGNLTLSTISSTPFSLISSEDINISRSSKSPLSVSSCKTSPHKRLPSLVNGEEMSDATVNFLSQLCRPRSLSLAFKRSSHLDVRGNLTLSTISSTPFSLISSEDINISRTSKSPLSIGSCKTSPHKRLRSPVNEEEMATEVSNQVWPPSSKRRRLKSE